MIIVPLPWFGYDIDPKELRIDTKCVKIKYLLLFWVPIIELKKLLLKKYTSSYRIIKYFTSSKIKLGPFNGDETE